MSRHRLEIREVPGGRTFYMDGSLQFDSRDEAVYHEALALPALALASARGTGPLSALVLGGGDGLALRRLLASGRVKRAELVDYDAGVLDLARTEFAAFNGGALADPRVKVCTRDALRHLKTPGPRADVALADFTFPEDLAACSLFTRAFFSAVRARLASGGVFAMNAFSPDRFPAAFWSVYRTLASARLYPRPLRVSIPSFTAHGYGDWGMFLASPRPIKDAELAALRFGRGNAWLNAGTFRETLRLRVSSLERGLPLSGVIKKPGDLLCLMNLQEPAFHHGGALADFADSAAARRLLAAVPGSGRLPWPQLSADWEWRLMETLRLMDWESFLAELEAGAAGLPARTLEEIKMLRARLPELLKGAVPDADRAWQVFAVLLTLLVFANVAYPDNAYAKGSYHSGSGGGGDLEITFFIQSDRTPFHHAIYQGAEVMSVLTPAGAVKAAELLRYRAPEAPAGGVGVKEDRLYFALGDESYVSREGELFFSLGPTGYLYNVRRDRFLLMDKLLPEPLFEFCPEQASVQAAQGDMERHLKAADKALEANKKWLAWAGPARAFSREIRAEENEAANIEKIRASLQKASERLVLGPAPAPYPEIQSGWVRLAPGLYLVDDFEIVLAGKGGVLYSYPYLVSGGKYASMPSSPELDRFITAMVSWRNSQLSPNHPQRIAYELLLDMKAKK